MSDSRLSSSLLQLSGECIITSTADALTITKSDGTSKPLIKNIEEPTDDDDVATKKYVDDTAGGGGSGTECTYITTIPFPVHKDEINFENKRPVYCYLQTNGRGLKFNKGRIFITQAGWSRTYYLAVYKLTSSATFNDYTTYNNSTKIVESDSVAWTSSSGSAGNGEGFVYFDFVVTTTLNETDIYFVGMYNNGTGPKYLGYKDAGDPGRGLDGMFYISNTQRTIPASTMENTNTSDKGDPPYINLYYGTAAIDNGGGGGK